jgi:hypothetical protein
MTSELLVRLERAIRGRKPGLIGILEPGLPESRIRRMLARGKVTGCVEPVVEVFSWRSGTQGKPGITMEEMSLFPDPAFILVELELMIAHFRGFEEVVGDHPKYEGVIGRYFPLFWNGSSDFLAVDLDPSRNSRVVIIEHKAEKLVREGYASFDGFLEDAIRANEKNEKLACFQTK